MIFNFHRKIFIILLFHLLPINAQSLKEIDGAKSLFKNSGLSKVQAIELAKKNGYNDAQIKDVIKKHENNKIETNAVSDFNIIQGSDLIQNENSIDIKKW